MCGSRRAALLRPLELASSRDHTFALQITEALGGLPLALDQAGAYLEETGCSLSDYQRLYQQHLVTLLKQRRGLVADHPEPVAATWSLSFVRVEEAHPVAADLLRFCAYLPPDAIAQEIITQGAAHLGPRLEPIAADALLLGQAMEALRAYSLVSCDPASSTLSVHRLVQAYSLVSCDPASSTLSVHRLVQAVLRDDMDAPTRKCWAERAIRAVHAALPPVEHANWPQWERLLAHAQACVEWIEPAGVHLQEAAKILQQAGLWRLFHVHVKRVSTLADTAGAGEHTAPGRARS